MIEFRDEQVKADTLSLIVTHSTLLMAVTPPSSSVCSRVDPPETSPLIRFNSTRTGISP